MFKKKIFGGRWRIFEQPNPSEMCIIGIDTASGKENSNESVGCVLSVHTGVQKAVFAGKYTPDELTQEVLKAGYLFYFENKKNPAEIVVEMEFHGATVISGLRHANYPNIYFHGYNLTTFKSESTSYGFSPRTYRQLAIDYLQEDIGRSISKNPEEKRRGVFVKDPDTIAQLGWFQRNKKTGKFEATKGKYDDRVSALMIANFARRERMWSIFNPVVEQKPREETHADVIMAGLPKVDVRNMGPRDLN